MKPQGNHCIPAEWSENLEQCVDVYIGIITLGNSLSVSYKGKYMPSLCLWFHF